LRIRDATLKHLGKEGEGEAVRVRHGVFRKGGKRAKIRLLLIYRWKGQGGGGGGGKGGGSKACM